MALKFTVHGVQSFIKGPRKSGVISIQHSRDELAHLQWNDVLSVTATYVYVWGGGICLGITLTAVTKSSLSDSLDNSKNSSLDPAHLPFGLPLPLLSKYQVSLTGDKHLQVHSYLFEFSESLSVLGNLLQAVKWALDEAVS